MKKVLFSALAVMAVGAAVIESDKFDAAESYDMLLLKNVEALSQSPEEGLWEQDCSDNYEKAPDGADREQVYSLLDCSPCDGSSIDAIKGSENTTCITHKWD
ncbi:MAG: hypothetical protein E7070_10535 [Bacteroidales bacterium]|nr:hypothetical protein [Bacteroidales bacterium]